MNLLGALRDFFFPRRLKRISHIIRFSLWLAFIWWLILYRPPRTEHAELLWHLLGLLLAFPYLILFCIAPRARDSGLPVWASWLFFVPAVNLILVYALFFSRTKRPELEHEET